MSAEFQIFCCLDSVFPKLKHFFNSIFIAHPSKYNYNVESANSVGQTYRVYKLDQHAVQPSGRAFDFSSKSPEFELGRGQDLAHTRM